jgi:hypothetical protein
VFEVRWTLHDVELRLAANLCSMATETFPQLGGRELCREGAKDGSRAGAWSVRWTMEAARAS